MDATPLQRQARRVPKQSQTRRITVSQRMEPNCIRKVPMLGSTRGSMSKSGAHEWQYQFQWHRLLMAETMSADL
eukprot:1676636-Lingulodinium_polyedra.AAC.1